MEIFKESIALRYKKRCIFMAVFNFEKIKESAIGTAKSVRNKITEIKESEPVNKIIHKADEIKKQTISKAEKYINTLQENKQVKGILDKGNGIVEVVGNRFNKIASNEDVLAVWNKTTEVSTAVGKTTLKGLKVITGISAITNRKQAIATKEEANKLKAEIESTNESIRDDLNETLEDFGKVRLEALHNTVGKFLSYLDKLNQKAKSKEYDFLKEIDISYDEIQEMKKVDMKASDALKVAAVGGGFAAIALAGTGPLVTSAVTAFATASTGTAISSLSGAAATNAVLAWLGGGSLAAGGGGMAAGAATLATITTVATTGVAIIAVGTLASAFYAKKNTEATKYLAEVQEWAEQVKASWIVIGGIKQRVLELQGLTQQLESKSLDSLQKLGDIVESFDANNVEHTKVFQQSAIMIKSMSELAQVPILDNDGNLNEQVNIVSAKTEKVLNSEL
ncbi:MAG: hypothetical protein IKN82_09270 [Treponema sp.]|nr:hypothetical protein [Treponema sp.]